MTGFCIVYITAGSAEEAETLARSAVERRLAACCSIVPNVRSIYRWQGAVEDDTEHLLIVKTRREQFEDLERHIRAMHSYEVPELLVLPVIGGDADYLDWLRDSLG